MFATGSDERLDDALERCYRGARNIQVPERLIDLSHAFLGSGKFGVRGSGDGCAFRFSVGTDTSFFTVGTYGGTGETGKSRSQ